MKAFAIVSLLWSACTVTTDAPKQPRSLLMPHRSKVISVKLVPTKAPACQLDQQQIDELYALSGDRRLADTNFARVFAIEFTDDDGEVTRLESDGKVLGDDDKARAFEGLEAFRLRVRDNCNR